MPIIANHFQGDDSNNYYCHDREVVCESCNKRTENKHQEVQTKITALRASHCFHWYWTYFGRVDILHHEILLQGTSSLGEGESIGGGLGKGGGAQKTNALRKQTHLS